MWSHNWLKWCNDDSVMILIHDWRFRGGINAVVQKQVKCNDWWFCYDGLWCCFRVIGCLRARFIAVVLCVLCACACLDVWECVCVWISSSLIFSVSSSLIFFISINLLHRLLYLGHFHRFIDGGFPPQQWQDRSRAGDLHSRPESQRIKHHGSDQKDPGRG